MFKKFGWPLKEVDRGQPRRYDEDKEKEESVTDERNPYRPEQSQDRELGLGGLYKEFSSSESD
jgi:hypothetical protein